MWSSSSRREWFELLASMRFAITLLSVLCIASVIGTVLRQREPLNNYINAFGPFWAQAFGQLDLFTVYSAPWFLLILGFLVLSTSLCIARHTPKIVRDWQDAKLKVRAESLKAHHHHSETLWPSDLPATRHAVAERLAAQGWACKLDERATGQLLASRKGRVHKLGYLAAHSAIVLICVGGLLDGDLIVRVAMKLQGTALFTGSGNVTQPERHKLSLSNPSFRGNLYVPEGQRANAAVLPLPGGLVLQELPFELELKRFIVEHYETGMPKKFASDVVLRDAQGSREARIEVNKPLIHQGIAIYQSSFEDGGSSVELRAEPLTAGASETLQAQVGGSLERPGKERLEVGELRPLNVEDFSQVSGATEAASAPSKGLAGGSAAKDPNKKTLRNIGPSITYRLRDAAGQAREFHHYMLPVDIGGLPVFLMGVRESVGAEFQYLRIPADEQGSLQGWLRLRRALHDPAQRQAAGQAYAQSASQREDLRPQLSATAAKALALLAGAEALQEGPPGGLPALAHFIEKTVPEAERERVSAVMLRVLSGALGELDRHSRQAAAQPAPADEAQHQRFMTQALMSLSDSVFYPATTLYTLQGFQQKQASVFQVTRAPGQKLVYLGAVLLMLGVFAMLYLRERRLWVWLAAHPDGTTVQLAYSSPRQGSETEAEFQSLKTLIQP